MRNKVIIGALFLILFMNLIVAIEPEFIVRQGIQSDLRFSCMDEATGIPCADLFNCSITIKYPNESIMMENIFATNQISDYNITIGDSTVLGFHQYQSYCTNGTAGGFSEEQYFLINVIGEEISTGKSILYVIGLLMGTLFFVMSLYGAILIPFGNSRNENNHIIGINDLKYVKILLWFIAYLLLVSITFMAKTVTGFLEAGIATGMFNFLFWMLIVFLLPIFILTITIAFVNFFADKKVYDKLTRNITIR